MKKFLIIIGVILLVAVLVFFLNLKFKWIGYDEKEPIREEEIEKDTAKLIFNNKDYINKLIDLINIDIVENFSESDLDDLANLNSELEIEIKNNPDFKKEVITIEDLVKIRTFLIITADNLNLKLAQLSNKDFNEYVTLGLKMELNDYFYVDQIEGMLMVDINYAHLYNELIDNLTDEAADYLKLKYNIYNFEKSNSIFKDGGLVIKFSQFKDVILLYDAYAQKYDNDFFNNEYKFNYEVFVGKQYMPNLSLIGEDNKIQEEYLIQYTDILDNNLNFTYYEDLEEVYNNNK